MKTRMTLVCCAAVLLSAALGFAEEDRQVFADKAAELTAGKESRVSKIVALNAFVRDEIAQVKTTYG